MRGTPVITVGSAGPAFRGPCPPPTPPCIPAMTGVPAVPWRFPPCRNGVFFVTRRVPKFFSERRVSKFWGGCR